MSDNTKTTPTVDTSGITVEARVRPVTPKNNLIGFANVNIGGFCVVDDIPVKQGKNGIFFDNPSKPDGRGGYKETFKPITADFRNQVTEAIKEGYGRAIEKIQALGDAHQEKTPIKDQLAKGAEAAKAQAPIPRQDAPKQEAAR